MPQKYPGRQLCKAGSPQGRMPRNRQEGLFFAKTTLTLLLVVHGLCEQMTVKLWLKWSTMCFQQEVIASQKFYEQEENNHTLTLNVYQRFNLQEAFLKFPADQKVLLQLLLIIRAIIQSFYSDGLSLECSQMDFPGGQLLRICLPMQGTRVRALVWEDPTCRRATKPVRHNY